MHPVLYLVLAFFSVSCNSAQEPRAQSLAFPKGFDSSVAQELVPLTDEVGRYFVASSRGVDGDDGFFLQVEERHYLERSQVRFVVIQHGLARRDQAAGLEDMRLTLYQQESDVAIASHDLIEGVKLEGIPSILHATEFFPSSLLTSKPGERVCAMLETIYTSESFYPLVLNTCDQRSISLLQ